MRPLQLAFFLALLTGAAHAQPVAGTSLRVLVDSAHAAGAFDGAVMVFDGRQTTAAVAGLADRSARTPWTLATRSPW